MFGKEKFKKAVNLTMIEKGLSQAKLSNHIAIIETIFEDLDKLKKKRNG